MVRIESVSFGEIRIDGKDYYSDVIVWWDGKVDFVTKSHRFGMSELVRLLKKNPDVIIVGTGMEGSVQIEEEAGQKLEDKGISFFPEKTPNAVEVFNSMVSDGRKAVALLHITC
ncbi:MAG: MTH938/NDUFAF3 family protein [Candidatus Aenigmatarchaeota archaeon]